MLKIFEQYKSHPFAKYFLILFGVIVVYLAYHIYIWNHTESTDNADTGLKNQDKKIIMLFPIFAFFKLQFVHNFV
ncbi:hypothetical protein [Candidatus Tisiphia endosymbiont of Empis tessellata]|uniref:hypothetical protein n=1 Tax=Candidatus Tisiphia endosymbiont of Empis tessellata TaxID=3066259 RepID=UPI00313BF8DE